MVGLLPCFGLPHTLREPSSVAEWALVNFQQAVLLGDVGRLEEGSDLRLQLH